VVAAAAAVAAAARLGHRSVHAPEVHERKSNPEFVV